MMLPTLRRSMASAVQSSAFKPAPMNLLPPIPLYRRLLRAHRKHLPPEMRLLGDEYVKAEFRAHRDVENPVHLVRCLETIRRACDHFVVPANMVSGFEVGFLSEWQLYAQKIEGDSWVGEKLDQSKIAKMSGWFPCYCRPEVSLRLTV
jgi:hypothetical protein